MKFKFLIPIAFMTFAACTSAPSEGDIQQFIEQTLTTQPTVHVEQPDTPLPTDTPRPTDTPLPSNTAEPTDTPQPTLTLIPEPEREIALVTRVIDGDTIEVLINDVTYRLRYIGMDAPEQADAFASEATEANRQLVEGLVVELEKDVSETDQFDRLLRYVYLDGLMINGEIVRLGLAKAIDYPPDIKYQVYLSKQEEIAQSEGNGMWAQVETTPTQVAGSSPVNIVVNPTCSQFNSPGNDNDTKAEEYVCLTNTGSDLVNMTGWTVADEHGWTFRFQTFTLSSGSSVRVRTGCGTNTDQDLYWCKDGTAVWNNGGDCAYLRDGQNNEIDRYCY